MVLITCVECKCVRELTSLKRFQRLTVRRYWWTLDSHSSSRNALPRASLALTTVTSSSCRANKPFITINLIIIIRSDRQPQHSPTPASDLRSTDRRVTTNWRGVWARSWRQQHPCASTGDWSRLTLILIKLGLVLRCRQICSLLNSTSIQLSISFI